MSKPKKPDPFCLSGEVVASCFVDDGSVADKGLRLVVVDAVFHLLDSRERMKFLRWLVRADEWCSAQKRKSE